MAPPDIDLIEMANPPISRGDGDVFELYVHVVLGYSVDTESSVLCPNPEPTKKYFGCGIARGGSEREPSINLPRYTWPDVISSVITWFYAQQY